MYKNSEDQIFGIDPLKWTKFYEENRIYEGHRKLREEFQEPTLYSNGVKSEMSRLPNITANLTNNGKVRTQILFEVWPITNCLGRMSNRVLIL